LHLIANAADAMRGITDRRELFSGVSAALRSKPSACDADVPAQ